MREPLEKYDKAMIKFREDVGESGNLHDSTYYDVVIYPSWVKFSTGGGEMGQKHHTVPASAIADISRHETPDD